MTEDKAIPKLASDTTRSYLILIAIVPIALVTPFLLVFLGAPVKSTELAIATLFISWSMIGFLTAALTLLVFRSASPAELRRWMLATTPRDRKSRLLYFLNGGGATGWAISASVTAVAAVLILSFSPQFRQSPVIVIAGIAVVIGSLFMTITSYAVRYARYFATARGIEFPGDTLPQFSDFIYLAVQVSTTFLRRMSLSPTLARENWSRPTASCHSLSTRSSWHCSFQSWLALSFSAA